MKKVFVMLTLVFSVNALATGFVCSEDMRPVDGLYRELQLEDKGNGTFDLTYSEAGGFASAFKTVKLATGASCNVSKADSRVANCFGDNKLLMMSKKNTVTQMQGMEGGNTVTSRYLEITVMNSKEESANKEYRFLSEDCKAK